MALTQPQRDLLEELESMPRAELTEDNKRLLRGLQQKREEARHRAGSPEGEHGSLRSVIEVGEGKRGTPKEGAPVGAPTARRGCPRCQSEEIGSSSLVDFVLHKCPCGHSWKTPPAARVARPTRSKQEGWPRSKFVGSPKRFRNKGKTRSSDDY